VYRSHPMMQQGRTSVVRDSLEVLAFVAVVVADALGFVFLTQTIYILPLIWIFLRLRKERWSSIGFSWPERAGRAILIGCIAGILMELFAVFVTTPIISGFFGVEPDVSDLKDVQGNLMMLLIFLALSWLLGGFGEELCFRGFLMARLARIFGQGRAAWIASLVLSSALFGWGHTEQGPSGWVQEGLSGFLLGVLFLANKRNLTVPIVAHGISNTVALVFIYFGRYPGLG
jgi:membrane protease YdiL (CAAX protease family)